MTLKFWQDALGLENVRTEEVAEQKCAWRCCRLAKTKLNCSNSTAGRSAYSEFFGKKARWQIHHIAVEVENKRVYRN